MITIPQLRTNQTGQAGIEVHCKGRPEDSAAGGARKKLGSSPEGLTQAEAQKRLPPDALLPDGDEISVDQSALTGESLPAIHKSGEAVFSGSIVRRGKIGALVYATGTNSPTSLAWKVGDCNREVPPRPRPRCPL